MIIAKTPLRVPLAGGLTDIKPYVEQFSGLTISATINKYVYVAMKPNVDGYISLKYMDVHEKVKDVSSINHDLVRECIKFMQIKTPLDIYIMNDINIESGLGSSGALTVGLLAALHKISGKYIDDETLAKEAAYIEVEVLDGASGYHDPTICALGGVREIKYYPQHFEHRKLGWQVSNMIEERARLFYTGYRGKSKTSLSILINQFADAAPILHDIKLCAEAMMHAYENKDVEHIEELLGKAQALKQSLPGKFYNKDVEELMQKVQEAGCYGQIPGGKVGSFLFVMGHPSRHEQLRKALQLTEVPFHFVERGVMVQEI